MSKPPVAKSSDQILRIRTAGQYLDELLLLIASHAKPGVALIELEHEAVQFLKFHNIHGAFKGYHGFPANLCLSVNDCVVHGIPDETVLKEGDLLKIDAGTIYEKCIADAAISIVIGGFDKNPAAAHLIQTTKQALDAGVQQIAVGKALIHYAHVVHETVTEGGCSILRNLTGHGVGIDVHEWPSIYNRPHPSLETIRRTDQRVVALEPITAQKSIDFKEKPGNNRNLYTRGGDLGAQREYTIVITPDGPEILAGIKNQKDIQ